MRIDTLRKNLVNEMASIVVHGRHPSERFVTIANNIQLSWEDKIYPGGVWSLDVGVRDITKDNPEILKWAQKRWPDGLPSSTRVTKEYVTHLMDNVLPEGANYRLKGQAIQGQNMKGTEFGKGASGARKDDLYFRWWGDKEGVRRLPDGSLLYQADTLGSDVTRPPTSGAPSEYIEALSKEDWRKRKRLSPNQKIKNSYGEQWGVPRENWWKVEGTGEGGIEGRLKTKGLAYDNFKSGIRRALTKGKTLQMSPWEWDAVYEAYKYAQKHGYHVDHIDPISGTGYHVWDNLQILDANDNLVKGAKTNIEGIIPKRTTYLVQGPLTEQDWVKYTKKNAGLATRRSKFLKRAIAATATATAGVVSNPLKSLAAIPDVIPATYAFDALSLGVTQLDKWGTQQLPDDHVFESGATKQQALDFLNRQIGADVVGLEPTGIGNIPAVLHQQTDPRETEEQKRARSERAIENVRIMQQHGMNPFF